MQKNIVENNFRKVLVASQRARQLEKGARPLVKVDSLKVTCIALKEVDHGLINYEMILPPAEPGEHGPQ
ncbi:MAG: DNA-directed RNA polymerase subunit omega [Blastocatellales bacterium]